MWWTRGYYPEEDEGIRRIVADFERDTRQIVVLNYWTQEDLPTKVIAALAADELPDVVAAATWYVGLTMDYSLI